MTDKQIIIDENKINPNDWLEPYKPIPACEIKDCDHLVYAGNDVYGCRIAEDGLVCDDFNNDDECCMYRQLEYYKETLKAKEQECEKWKNAYEVKEDALAESEEYCEELEEQLEAYKMEAEEGREINAELKAENDKYKKMLEDEDVQLALTEIRSGERHLWYNKAQKLSQALTEIKEIAKFYVNSTVGDKQEDGTFKVDLEKCTKSGTVYFTYDPRPANQILQKISEVLDE